MTTALLIIDVQNAVLDGEGTPERQPAIDAALTETIGRLQSIQARARAAHIPVILVQHDGGPGDPLARSSNGWGLRHEIAPVLGETVIHKMSCDTFFPHKPRGRAGETVDHPSGHRRLSDAILRRYHGAPRRHAGLRCYPSVRRSHHRRHGRTDLFADHRPPQSRARRLQCRWARDRVAPVG